MSRTRSTSRGAAVVTAANGPDALTSWRSEPFDAVLMDVEMPGMDGLEVTRAIRSEERRTGSGAHVPIVAMTAHAMKDDRARCLAAGMDGYLAKPVETADFVRVLGRLRHANIVRIFDSSVADGRFYYVMDYIPGLPLDAHVRQALPTLSSRDELVQLFVKICDAVNAAHLRGIIHRDLKPGNIRVDREGEPFVLDFGLSKLAGESSSDVTQSGQFVGSIPWASPSQASAC